MTSSLKKMVEKEVREAFENFRFSNKTTDENKLREYMLSGIMEVYMFRLINQGHQSTGEAIKIITNLLNDFASSDPDYLPANRYKNIIAHIKEYSLKLKDDVDRRIDESFLDNATIGVSKTNKLNAKENPSAQLKEAVCEGYRTEIMNKIYKVNNDFWFKR